MGFSGGFLSGTNFDTLPKNGKQTGTEAKSSNRQKMVRRGVYPSLGYSGSRLRPDPEAGRSEGNSTGSRGPELQSETL